MYFAGGRCSEKLILGQVSSGASDDLKQCTRLARRMVTQWGMSDQIGPVNFPQNEEHPFRGMEISQAQNFSDHTARLIDEALASLIKRSEQKTDQLLTEHKNELERLTKGLLEHETLEADDIKKLMQFNEVKNAQPA